MKNKFPLFVAVLVGAVALFAVRSYVNKMEQNTQAQLRGDPVVAAARDIPAGVELTAQMVTTKQVPRKFIPPQAIEAGSFKQVMGRKTAVKVQAGQVILWTDMVSEGKGTLASLIPAGEGAYTVSISKGIKPALIQPSDHVDIIGSFAVPKAPMALPNASANWRTTPDMVNVVLLQNVSVLAVGDTLGGASRNQGSGGADLTLSLTLPEAQLLMFAAEHGELGAILRREGETEVKGRSELPRISFDAIDKIIGDLDGRRGIRMVEVQQGSKSTAIPVLNAEAKASQP